MPTPQQILEEAAREEFLAVELLMRLFRVDRRTMLEDCRRRHIVVTWVGRTALIPCAAIRRHYLTTDFSDQQRASN